MTGKDKQSHQEEAFQQYQRLIPYLVGKMTNYSSFDESDKEDLISAAYIKLWEISENYEPKHSIRFKAYMYIRIKGCIIDEIRKKRNYLNRASLLAEQFKSQIKTYQDRQAAHKTAKQAPEVPGKGSHIENEIVMEEHDMLQKALKKLPQKERMLIEKHYFEGKAFKEIVKNEYKVSKSWISKMHRISLQHLKEIYQKELDS